MRSGGDYIRAHAPDLYKKLTSKDFVDILTAMKHWGIYLCKEQKYLCRDQFEDGNEILNAPLPEEIR